MRCDAATPITKEDPFRGLYVPLIYYVKEVSWFRLSNHPYSSSWSDPPPGPAVPEPPGGLVAERPLLGTAHEVRPSPFLTAALPPGQRQREGQKQHHYLCHGSKASCIVSGRFLIALVIAKV